MKRLTLLLLLSLCFSCRADWRDECNTLITNLAVQIKANQDICFMLKGQYYSDDRVNVPITNNGKLTYRVVANRSMSNPGFIVKFRYSRQVTNVWERVIGIVPSAVTGNWQRNTNVTVPGS